MFAALLVTTVALGIVSVGAPCAFAQTAPSPALVPPGGGLAWGYNIQGELGDGTNTNSNVPVDVDLPTGVTITAITAGGFHSLALTSTGTVLAWGFNGTGQLGNGTNTNSNVPVDVDLPTGVTITAITAGYDHSLALTSTGTVLAWGNNAYGQLGDGTNTNSNVPVDVNLPTGVTITAITAGSYHSLALTSTGTVLAWGLNGAGQLGDGTNTSSNVPVQVDLPAGTTITAIAAGGFHSLALTSTGTVLAWGLNNFGQLGDGTNTNSNIPVQVDLPAGVTITAIAAGGDHSLALTSTGTVLAWGLNVYGQLGNGTNTNSNIPVNVDLPAGTTITAIAAGGVHSLALTSTGTVLAWGLNSSGQLGDGTNTDSNIPVQVDLPAGVTITAIAAGGAHSLAIAGPLPVSTTTLRVSPPNPLPNQEVTLSASVTCNTGRPTGAVTFLDDGTTIGTATLTGDPATATLALPSLTPGTHTIRAHYNGNTNCPVSESDPITITIAQPTSAVRLSVAPEHPRPNEPVTLTATVTCNAATPTGTVTFLDGTTTLDTTTLSGDPATATLTLPSLTPGTHTIRARYNGNTDCPTATSSPTPITLRPVLPVTGTSLLAALTIGTLLILTGGALLLTIRRRRAAYPCGDAEEPGRT